MLLMLRLAMDASFSVTLYVPFGSLYHNLKWIRSCKKGQIWRPDSYMRWQLDVLGFRIIKLLLTLCYERML